MTSDLSPEYLAAVRHAADDATPDGSLVTVAMPYHSHALYTVASRQASLDETDDRVTILDLAHCDTLGAAETIRTLLQAVPRLLDEIDRLRAANGALDEGTTEWGIRHAADDVDPATDEAEARQLAYPGETVVSRTVTDWTEATP